MASTLVEALKEGRYKNATDAIVGAEFNRQVDEETREAAKKRMQNFQLDVRSRGQQFVENGTASDKLRNYVLGRNEFLDTEILSELQTLDSSFDVVAGLNDTLFPAGASGNNQVALAGLGYDNLKKTLNIDLMSRTPDGVKQVPVTENGTPYALGGTIQEIGTPQFDSALRTYQTNLVGGVGDSSFTFANTGAGRTGSQKSALVNKIINNPNYEPTEVEVEELKNDPYVKQLFKDQELSDGSELGGPGTFNPDAQSSGKNREVIESSLSGTLQEQADQLVGIGIDTKPMSEENIASGDVRYLDDGEIEELLPGVYGTKYKNARDQVKNLLATFSTDGSKEGIERGNRVARFEIERLEAEMAATINYAKGEKLNTIKDIEAENKKAELILRDKRISEEERTKLETKIEENKALLATTSEDVAKAKDKNISEVDLTTMIRNAQTRSRVDGVADFSNFDKQARSNIYFATVSRVAPDMLDNPNFWSSMNSLLSTGMMPTELDLYKTQLNNKASEKDQFGTVQQFLNNSIFRDSQKYFSDSAMLSANGAENLIQDPEFYQKFNLYVSYLGTDANTIEKIEIADGVLQDAYTTFLKGKAVDGIGGTLAQIWRGSPTTGPLDPKTARILMKVRDRNGNVVVIKNDQAGLNLKRQILAGEAFVEGIELVNARGSQKGATITQVDISQLGEMALLSLIPSAMVTGSRLGN